MVRDSKGRFVDGKEPFKLDEELIIKKYNEGLSCKNISILLKVSPQTIHRRLIKNNIKRRIGEFQKGHAPLPGSEKAWFKKGHKSAAWKRGYRIQRGYKEMWVGGKQRYIKEHRLIMEKHLGRKLKSEENVHHINFDKLDNRIENLQLMTNSEHSTIHGKKNYKNKISALYKHNNRNKAFS